MMLLAWLASLALAQDMLPVEDLNKEGALQAIHQSLDGKFSTSGGNVTGLSGFMAGAYVPYYTGKFGVLSAVLVKSTDTASDYSVTVATDGVLVVASTTTTGGVEYLTSPNDMTPHRVAVDNSGVLDLLAKAFAVYFSDFYLLDSSNVIWRVSLDRGAVLMTTSMGAI